jgi:photosystem II stability/assembly factor-like uncharacterized protein
MKDLVRKRVAFLTYRATIRHHSAVVRVFRYALLALAWVSIFDLPFASVFAQGTAFTYQGQLHDSGNPANGKYDLQFAVYNSNVGGTRIAGPLTNSPTVVSNGLFTVTNLDFGPGVFTGPPRWLDIGVRTNGSAGAFTSLSPRQPLLPAPYAIFANGASNLLGTLPASQLAGTLPASAFVGYTNTVSFTNPANLFSGTFNGAFGGIFTGSFFGNGGGVTNVNVTNLTGVLADKQLPSNTAFINSNQTFSGANIFTNFNNSFRGSFFGNGLVGWVPTNGTTIQAVIDTGYLLNNSQLVTVTLPSSPNPGDIVRISGAGASGWKVAQNSGQSIIGNFSSFVNSPWSPSGASPLLWRAIASSADGSRLAAVASGTGGGIFISIDSGVTWTGPFGPLPSANWDAVATSADGSKVVAAVNGNGVYTNSGTTWTISFGSANWTSVASSADGSKLYAASSSGVYNSVNSGGSWSAVQGPNNWVSVACSADGTKYVAAVGGGGIVASGGSGAPGANWVSVASSADGNRLAAAVGGGGIYTSSNGGANWSQQTGAPTSANWTSICSSADGSKLAATVNAGVIYTSSNYGVTWAQQTNAPVKSWSAIASSADGTKLAAAINNATIGGIYLSHASVLSTTTVGANGYIVGSQGSAVELQYIGNNQFMPVSFAGNIWAY